MKPTDAQTANRVAAPVMSAKQAEYELSWEEQIDALTAPGLSDEERVMRFCEAAELDAEFWPLLIVGYGDAPAPACWQLGMYPKSLFADLPGCKCPVLEGLDGVPHYIPDDWDPTPAQLRIFAHHQREARFGS